MLTHLWWQLPDQLWVPHIGRPLRARMGDFARDGAEAERMVAMYIKFQRQVHDEMTRCFPGALKTLTALRVRGVRLGVVNQQGA